MIAFLTGYTSNTKNIDTTYGGYGKWVFPYTFTRNINSYTNIYLDFKDAYPLT